MKSRIPAAANNRITLVGSAIASLALVLILFFLVVGMVTHGANPYLGIITFAALPAVLNGGIVLAIFGYIRHRRRLRAGMETTPATFTFNTADRSHWKRLFAGVAAAGAFLLLTAFGSYQAYQYTETEDFCGRVCHNVMKPEYVAYKSSPHARVGCVQCHIGDGAEWFVKSKISGSYQVYSVLFNKYHRPIETPISNLRPARETCEKCHWPKQFYSAKLQSHTYYATDEKNTPSNLDMLVKIGGGNASHGATEGI
ncbi:MAG: NapC/NirT family cytochrome c, partial [Armatimonadetes bacterium]|nr:NapC/NirT family cytochrome c [Armatimonadota bacterium]